MRGRLTIGVDARLALLDNRGWGRYAEGLLRAFARRPELQVIALLPDSPFATAVGDALSPEIRVIGTGFTAGPPADLYQRPEYQIEPLTWTGPVDIFHSLTRFTPRTTARHLVVTVHDIAPLSVPPYKLNYHAPTVQTLSYLRQRDARLIAVSDFTRAELIKYGGVAPAQVTVIPEGVSDRLRESRAVHCAPAPYLLYVGGGNSNKNLDRLLEAMARVRTRYPIDLVIAGKWGWEHEAQSDHYARCQPWLRHLDYVEEEVLAALYRGAQALVQPSLHEGFGLPLIEAMALGTPVICSDIPVFREVAGSSAEFFSPHSVEAMTEAMWRVLENPRWAEALSSLGRARAQPHTWDQVATQTIERYRQVLAGEELLPELPQYLAGVSQSLRE